MKNHQVLQGIIRYPTSAKEGTGIGEAGNFLIKTIMSQDQGVPQSKGDRVDLKKKQPPPQQQESNCAC
jgi:hypothetical protein